MSDPIFATVEDVRSRWIASSIMPERETVQAYLEDASMIMAAEYPQLQANCESDSECARRARLVCSRMVMRVLTNPDQHRQVQETTGPFAGTVTFGAETLGGLMLTQEDRALLAKAPSRRVFSIAPVGFDRLTSSDEDPVLYVEQVVNH